MQLAVLLQPFLDLRRRTFQAIANIPKDKLVVDAGNLVLPLLPQRRLLEGILVYLFGTFQQVGGSGEVAVGEQHRRIEDLHPGHH